MSLIGNCQKCLLFHYICFFFLETGAANPTGVQGIQWVLQTHNEPIYEKDMLELLNNLETLEPVNDGETTRLRFEVRDIDVLTRKCTIRTCLDEKKIAIIKYKRKIEALQCVNAAIVHHALLSMNYFRFKQGNVDYQKTAARMLSLLYHAKIPAHNWLWSFYFRMGSPDDYKTIELDNNYPEERLQDDIIKHLELCRSYKYLPSDYRKNVGEKKFENDKLIRIRQYFYKDENTDLEYLKKIYSVAKQFKVTNLTLSNVYNNQQFLFHKLGNVEISWEETKLLLNKGKLRPIESESYSLIMRIIKSNILYLLWKHSTILCISLEKTVIDLAKNFTIRKILVFRNSILHGFDLAIQNLGLHNDHLFMNILLNLTQPIRVIYWFNIECIKHLKEMNENLKSIIIEDLTNLNVKPHEIELLFRPSDIPSNVDQLTNLNSPQYRDHIDQLLSYGENFKNVLEPTNFYTIEFLIKGKSKLLETFFMY